MKKLIIISLLLVLIWCMFPKTSTYSELFRIISIDYTGDIVYVINANGQVFSFTGAEDWLEGDYLTAIMQDNGTDTVKDDSIVSVKYERVDLLL